MSKASGLKAKCERLKTGMVLNEIERVLGMKGSKSLPQPFGGVAPFSIDLEIWYWCENGFAIAVAFEPTTGKAEAWSSAGPPLQPWMPTATPVSDW